MSTTTHRRPLAALLRSLREPAAEPAPVDVATRLVAAHRALGAALVLLADHPGRAYVQVLAAETEISLAKNDLTLAEGERIVEALLAEGRELEARLDPAPVAAGDGVPAGCDCEVTAHPEGGYTLLWASDRTHSGKYATRADARRFAELNGYRCHDRTVLG